jgi:hypothetical protein
MRSPGAVKVHTLNIARMTFLEARTRKMRCRP